MINSFYTNEKNMWNINENWEDSLSRVYNDTVHINFRVIDTDILLNYILKVVENYSINPKFLDICGGWGRISLPLAQLGYETIVIDGSDNYLRYGEKIREKLNIEKEKITFKKLNIEKDSLDSIEDCNIYLFIEGIEYFDSEKQKRIMEKIFNKMNKNDFLIITAVDKLAYINFQIRKMLFFSKIPNMIYENKFVDLAGNFFSPVDNTVFNELIKNNCCKIIDNRRYLQLDNLINSIGNFMQSSYYDNKNLPNELLKLNYDMMYDENYKDYGFFHIALLQKEKV